VDTAPDGPGRSIQSKAGMAAMLAVFAASAAASAVVLTASDRASAEQPSRGNLNGWVAAKRTGGESVPAESVSVFVLFTNEMEEGNFSHDVNDHTAGGRFALRLDKLLEKNKALKYLRQTAGENPAPGVADELSALYLANVDGALAHVRVWVSKRANRSWQMLTLTTDEKGQWWVNNVQPGTYTIVARGKISGYDGYWEGRVDLPPGATISAPLTRPRFLHLPTARPAR
jgi:hypothetical protein